MNSSCECSEANSEPVVHGFSPLTILVKSFISDVRLGSEYPSADSKPLLTFSKSQAAELFAN